MSSEQNACGDRRAENFLESLKKNANKFTHLVNEVVSAGVRFATAKAETTTNEMPMKTFRRKVFLCSFLVGFTGLTRTSLF